MAFVRVIRGRTVISGKAFVNWARIWFACIARNASDVDISGVFDYLLPMTPNQIYQHIGKVIRARRIALGMTQEVLAGKLQISRGGLANIEAGNQNILIHNLYAIGDALNLEVSDFLPFTPESTRLKPSELPLPRNLKKGQKEQIARFFDSVDVENDLS